MVEDNIGVMDSDGLEIQKKQLENIKLELDQFKTALEDIDKSIKNFSEQWDVDKELWELQLKDENYKLKEVSYKYQEEPRYWELIKTKLQFKYREDKALAEGRLNGFAKQREVIVSERNSLLEKYKELTGEDYE